MTPDHAHLPGNALPASQGCSQGAPLAPAGTFPHPSAPKPPEARRRRRADVAARLLAGEPVKGILRAVAEDHGASTTTVRRDIRGVVGEWARQDSRGLALRRGRVLRRIEANANACAAAGDLAGELRALALLAKLLGMFPSLSVATMVGISARHLGPEAGAEPQDVRLDFTSLLGPPKGAGRHEEEG